MSFAELLKQKQQTPRCTIVGCNRAQFDGKPLCRKHQVQQAKSKPVRHTKDGAVSQATGQRVMRKRHESSMMTARQKSRVLQGFVESTPDDYIVNRDADLARQREARHRLEDRAMMASLMDGV